MAQKVVGDIIFGQSIIPATQVFLLRKNVFGMINHKPYEQGHVLVCSRREVQKIQDLTEIESLDLFMTAQEIAKKLEVIYKKRYQIFIQNGKDAGQTVNHAHLHLIPNQEKEGLERKEAIIRSEEDMAREADQYRTCFENSAH